MTPRTRIIPQIIPALNIPSTTWHPVKLNNARLIRLKEISCFFMISRFDSNEVQQILFLPENIEKFNVSTVFELKLINEIV
jgi:hypothetical protein